MHYWAVKPATDTEGKFIRIEQATTPAEAVKSAYGMGFYPKHSPLHKFDKGKWAVKDLGTRKAVIQSDRQRIALLTSSEGWFDPTDKEGR